MIPSVFTYKRAGSAEEACDLAAEYGEDAKYLAGGHSLLPLMKLRLAAPEVIIDLGGLRDLSYITDQGSHQRYDYTAPVFDFACRLVYDESGLVLDYPGIAVRAG